VGVNSHDNYYTGFVAIPHWFLALLLLGLTYVPWMPWHKLRWRFSLRTLLIVTTLVAVMLGIGIWLIR